MTSPLNDGGWFETIGCYRSVKSIRVVSISFGYLIGGNRVSFRILTEMIYCTQLILHVIFVKLSINLMARQLHISAFWCFVSNFCDKHKNTDDIQTHVKEKWLLTERVKVSSYFHFSATSHEFSSAIFNNKWKAFDVINIRRNHIWRKSLLPLIYILTAY